MIGLVWNGMMSFGGGWFFLVAAEAISVVNHEVRAAGHRQLRRGRDPRDGDLGRVLLAIVVMIVMVLGVNFVFWRPLVAWSERFRNETTEAAEPPRSIVLDMLRRSRLPARVGRAAAPGSAGSLDRATRPFGLAEHPLHADAAAGAPATSCSRSSSARVALWGAFLGAALHRRHRRARRVRRTRSCSAATRSCGSS